MIVENLLQSITRGKQGLNKGLSTGLPNFDAVTFGVQRRWLSVWAGDSGSGKTSLVLYAQVYQPFKQFCEDPSIDVHFLLFSFEMSAEVLLAKLLSIYIYETFGVVLSYGNILSLTEPLSEAHYQLIQQSLPWLEKFESVCEVIDKPVTAKGLYAVCKEWSKNFGTYTEEVTESGYTRETYTPKNSEQYLIVVVDHVKLLSVSTGHTSKQEIDEACDYLISFRNKCNFTINLVQQFNRNYKSSERRMGDNYLPDVSDLSDSSGPAQSAETVVTIYFPYREKRSKCESYDIRQLKDRGRLLCVVNVIIDVNIFKPVNIWKI